VYPVGVSKTPRKVDRRNLRPHARDLRKRICGADEARRPCGIREEVRVHAIVMAGLIPALACADAEGGGIQWWWTIAPSPWDAVASLELVWPGKRIWKETIP
jgi:hypothetical protein